MNRVWVLATAALAACSRPDFRFEGEHVVIATEVVDDVCAGTIESLDRMVDKVDEQLDLDPLTEPLRIGIWDFGESQEHGECTRHSCATFAYGQRLVGLRPYDVDVHALHELTHAQTRRWLTVPLFTEGIAVAIAPTVCPPDGDLPALDPLLGVESRLEFRSIRGSYYVGGELVTWLLATHGPERVLEFLSTLSRPEAATKFAEPEFVRASYRAHFGTELDDDIHAHIRPQEQLTPEDFGCVAPAVPMQDDRIRLQVTLDCDSTRVETDFVRPGQGYVDWLLTVPETQRYRLLDPLPPDTNLKIARCECEMEVSGERSVWDDGSNVGSSTVLEPGAYLVRWTGPLAAGIELDIAIEVDDPAP